MGRPLLTTSASPVGSVEMQDNMSVAMAGAEGQGPRNWCEMDADPDSESWWTSKQVFVESFTGPANEADRGTADRRIPARAEVEREKITENKGETKAAIVDFSTLFPPKFTITEEQLASVTLDAVPADEDDAFELDWDDDDDMEDMEIDVESAHCSALSTPAPSTPVAASRIISLPISVPTTPRRRTLPPPLSSTPVVVGTPIRQNSFQAHTSSMSPLPASSSMTIARVRGFAVHSPRTELVL